MEIMEGKLRNTFYYVFLFAYVIISTDIKLVQGQIADVDPRITTALVGEQISLLCRFGKPIIYCRIVVPGENPLNLSPNWDGPSGFSYFGEGLDKGQCGVTINRIMDKNNGTVKCSMGQERDSQEIQGFIDLIVARAPSPPELEVQTRAQDNVYEINQKFSAMCTVRDGRPPANISWYLDSTPIFDGLGPVETAESVNGSLFSTRQSITRYIQASDDRKTLVCSSSHVADRGDPQVARFQFNVKYRPQPLPLTEVYGLVLSTTSYINVTIRANPAPRIEWIVGSVSIPQGTQNDRFAAYEPVDIGNGEYNATLSIAGLTLEDTTKEYRLKAHNEFGTQEYIVRISSSEAAPSTGLDLASIIGIVVGVAVLLCIIGLIVLARVTGRWCFADKGSIAKPHPSETSDTESADIKGMKSKKFNLNFHGLFKKKSPKPTDGNAEQADEGNADDDNAAPSEATVIIEDAEPLQKEEKNLVYAELMLKPSDDGSNLNKSSTEYAEIVYVNPDEKKSDATPKSKV